MKSCLSLNKPIIAFFLGATGFVQVWNFLIWVTTYTYISKFFDMIELWHQLLWDCRHWKEMWYLILIWFLEVSEVWVWNTWVAFVHCEYLTSGFIRLYEYGEWWFKTVLSPTCQIQNFFLKFWNYVSSGNWIWWTFMSVSGITIYVGHDQSRI